MLSNKLWKNFEKVASECVARGGIIALECPTSCRYWLLRKVTGFLAMCSLVKVLVPRLLYGGDKLGERQAHTQAVGGGHQ